MSAVTYYDGLPEIVSMCMELGLAIYYSIVPTSLVISVGYKVFTPPVENRN